MVQKWCQDGGAAAVTSLFLKLLLAAILDGATKGRGEDNSEHARLLTSYTKNTRPDGQIVVLDSQKCRNSFANFQFLNIFR